MSSWVFSGFTSSHYNVLSGCMMFSNLSKITMHIVIRIPIVCISCAFKEKTV